MEEIILDLSPFEEKVSLHNYLKETLGFPFYYGGNLDALHDVLTSETRAARIIVRYPAQPKGKMVEYLPRLLKVFRDSAEENYHLEFVFERIA